MNKLSLLGIAAAGLCASLALAGPTGGALIGKAAPAFAVQDAKGKEIKLAALKGRYVVLEWTNFGCPFVRKHYDAGNMQALQQKYTKKGVEWLTVFSSAKGEQGYYPPSELVALAAKKKMRSSALIPDPKGTLGRLYGATNTPDMVVIDPTGQVIYYGAIDDRPSPDPESLKGADNFVADALDASMAGKPVEVQTERPYGCAVKYAE